ncbi:hypothetical protein GWK47_011629 [Chionoecetes opilio]|uniref:Uncharacterized protein n=1 Tax=Chionoecetes opilio TaxID=41210 RepID=A0A8J4Y1G6_CHIOP|nr:hypothetical protein GWK47_011629 [Chionoecetes opilio]
MPDDATRPLPPRTLTRRGAGRGGNAYGSPSPVARVHVDQKARTDWQRTDTLEILVKYCLQVYFKLYYDIKVHHRLEDGPKHIPKRSSSDEVAAQEGPKQL